MPTDHTRAIALDLRVRGEVRGLLLVARPVSTPEPVRRALGSLATQLALAMESAALTEEVHHRRSEARFASLVQHSSDLITVLGPDATVVYQSPSSERVLGYAPEELLGTRFDELLVPGEEGRLLHLLSDGTCFASSDGEALECALRHRDGSARQFEILFTDLTHDEHVQGIVLNGRDVSERKRFEEQLAHQAFHDPVTGLPNRALFVDRVRHRIARSRREAGGLAVIFLDLDDFKTINDSLGHAAGDEVLVAVAKRLATTIRASDTAARFGGDEFALLLEDVADVQEAADTAERLMEAVVQPFSLAGKELTVHCSMGISVLDGDDPTDADELIRDADAAMYIAKREGKDGYRLFEPEMHDGVMARLELRADLQRALGAGEFELFYQPVVRLSDSSVIGVEALLRWRHPERGLVNPDDFIPFAEETGLIVPMGRWVLRDACRQAVELQRAIGADPPLTMSVNLSVKQLQHSDVVADVTDALAESRLDPKLLTLGDHRVGDDERHRRRDRTARGAARARHPAGDGRLRHRLLLAQLPQPLPGRRAEDGSLLPARRSHARDLRPRQRGDRDRRDPAPRRRRRGHRAERAVADAARPRLRSRPGLPVRPADAGRRDDRGAAQLGRAGTGRRLAASRRTLEQPAGDAP